MTTPPLSHELEVATRLAQEAGDLLLAHLRAGLTVEHKTSADDPVTAADREASTLIMTALEAAFPEDGLLSEEEADNDRRLARPRVWIIDPIDGTKEYAGGHSDYCVSIGLAIEGEAVLGVVYAPATDELFTGVVGHGVTYRGRRGARPTGDARRVAVSDTEYSLELHSHDLPGMLPSGSIALKLALISAGFADATFTMSPRSEWDIAAGDALLRAAGGELRRRDGQAIRYNRPSPHVEQGIIGGFPDALAWLEGELRARALPTAHLRLRPDAPAWTTMTDSDQAALSGHPGIYVRHADGRVLALLVVDPTTRTVERAEGDVFHLERLTRDVTRTLGALTHAER
ncbi:3'(2'),5'-bisphosphate nucleotidase CysQ [Deinococcus sp.]|uniref:3'(2'),5'-bisphosphate nucleotidase CysQ n=1 Tax=Deinococcus sp. TaxID=47478 RepID=UPI002869DCEE|nr:3'(2'),5'-bisphosphate nucleotidase CysQ [Deinococcus sp.]